MSTLRNALIIFFLSCTTAIAAPASESSIRQLLAVTQAEKLAESMRNNMDLQINNIIDQALNGRTTTTKQQQAIDNMRNRVSAVMQSKFSWQNLEPVYLKLYKESFTEEEIAGMLSFYSTPSGQAVIHKMPVLMQQITIEIPRVFSGVQPQIQQIMKEFVAEMTALKK